jgi:uncharacterized repeat protein (TIGR01451 family)
MMYWFVSKISDLDVSSEERTYKWLEAAKEYENQVSNTSLEPNEGKVWQKIGYCYDFASRQAKNTDDFKNIRQQAAMAYEKASEIFSKNETLEALGEKAECLANAQYMRSWNVSEVSEKLRFLDGCRSHSKEAIQKFAAANKEIRCGQTQILLSKCLFERLYITSDVKESLDISQEALENADIMINTFLKHTEIESLGFAYSYSSLNAWFIANISEKEDDRKTIAEKATKYSEEAVNISKQCENPYLKAISRWASVFSNLYFSDNLEVSLQHSKEMLEQSTLTSDNYLKGISYYLQAHVSDWSVPCEANPNKRKQVFEEILKYSEEGIKNLELVFQDALIADTYLFPVQTFSSMASDFALNLSEKLLYSKRAIDIGKRGLTYALRSGAPEASISTLHALSKAYYYHSTLEQKKEEKAESLKNALGFRREYIKTAKDVFPSNLWILGVGLVYAAQIETDLSRVESDDKTKLSLLEEAISDMSEGVFNCKSWITARAVISTFASLAEFEDTFGGILYEGFLLTSENENLSKANSVYGDAAEDFKKVDLPSRVAESYWKIARNLDYVGDFDLAARNFENAFASYKAAAQRITQFSDFYLDYSSYMKAWSEIESAKKAHNDEKYEVAMVHYEKTSQLLRQSKSWMFLSLNFYAWSLLEQAEDLSRKEFSRESSEAFEKAVKFFNESKRILNSKMDSIDRKDERDFVGRLISVSEFREEYSRGRIAIEEAKVLSKKGDYLASAEKYSKGAVVFQKISLEDSDATGREAKPMIYLCRAWEKMSLAEARGSPIMYEEASELFKLANQNAVKVSAGTMALGHSSFCKALEAGTEFEITRSMAMYDESMRHMDTAVNYYLKAGYEDTSNYARATQRLFDAYVYMENAKRERDPSKQSRYYSMAEKVLETAAEHFDKARYQNKTEQVQLLLKKVKEERELTLSLGEIFNAQAITSSTAGLSSIAPTEELAVGLERFEHADIQAKLVQIENEIKVGDTISLTIQIVNVGKEAVSLSKIENIVPSGFQLVSKPDYCLFENMELTMKGKRLDPLRTDEIKISLKSFRKGSIEIKPRITCIDSTGHPIYNSPEPIVFNISGASLPGRVATGYSDLDNLLFGGLPENYSVLLSSPSSDEREQLIKKFLETGVTNGQVTYFITSEIGQIADLVEAYPSLFTLFLCNPRADVMIKSLPNVNRLKGVESLTDIEIALVKAFRTLDQSNKAPKRACITILSDVLLQHHAVITRKWLAGILPDLKSKGFTTLVVMNPQMHPSEEFQAIVGLFEGEIRISERETEIGLDKVLRIRKLYNQRYLENEIILSREKLES